TVVFADGAMARLLGWSSAPRLPALGPQYGIAALRPRLAAGVGPPEVLFPRDELHPPMRDIDRWSGRSTVPCGPLCCGDGHL
ncbi:MAG: hypothetical protein ACR2OH_05945, partial [Microthrixaceae bacterium]